MSDADWLISHADMQLIAQDTESCPCNDAVLHNNKHNTNSHEACMLALTVK